MIKVPVSVEKDISQLKEKPFVQVVMFLVLLVKVLQNVVLNVKS